ncbi:hypothetical protein [Acidovorax sp. BLS4]|uniref:hypothetical protein n=1 Tax=Acidovorax sp. BLS4 TaxID=3273430 RepID=UPI0029434650|nr:hypothetical protein [Paracidovorax avenae]WOI47701.1 hypothetical protein R1Z03_11010 [Paracidovorax avenae]
MPSNAPATNTLPAALPTDIEVFRAGTRTADDGSVHTITEADLAASAAAYDPAVHEAPHTVGHPQHNAPAYGWIERFAVRDGVLQIAASKQVEPQFAEMVATGRVKKRSMSFYHPNDGSNPKPGIWYPRHVAWLGAQPPSVKGLKDVNFSDAGAICFSEPVTPTTTPTDPSPQEPDDMSKELQEQLAKTQAELQASKDEAAKAQAEAAAAKKAAEQATATAASFAETARANRKAGYVSFAEAQIQAGKLLPKDKEMAVATLEALADTKPVEFAEGDATRKVSPAQWLQDLIAAAKPTVSFGEFAGGGSGGNAAAQSGQAKGKSDAEIDQAAQAYARHHKVNYAEALTAVTASFSS